jgi:hypothetical protein
LIGENTSDQEVQELRHLFGRHQDITRRVENLPNGIRTITETDNPRLLPDLISHTVGMIARLEAGDDPRVPVQSPTLDILFRNAASISTEIEIIDTGIIVIQTSDDPEVVAALQTHASEVTDLVERGMAAVDHSRIGRRPRR